MFDINKYDNETLAKIWNVLNDWEWAEELGDKPKGWDSMRNSGHMIHTGTKYEILSPIIKEIENKIGIIECLRWHNINNLGYTNEEFEDWWNNRKDIEYGD